LAAFVASHAIGHHGQSSLLPELLVAGRLPIGVAVFIVLALTANIAERGDFNPRPNVHAISRRGSHAKLDYTDERIAAYSGAIVLCRYLHHRARAATSSVSVGTPRATFTRSSASNGFRSPGFAIPSRDNNNLRVSRRVTNSTAAWVPKVVVPASMRTDRVGFNPGTRPMTA